MTLRECYEQMGSNYDDVIARFPNEAIIKKFAIKFVDDTSYPDLEKALEDKDVKEAFRAAHTLKGVCVNLGFDELYNASSELTELLRKETLEGSEELFAVVKGKYTKTIDAIKSM